MFMHQVLDNLAFPLVAVRKELFLIVQKFFVRLSGKFKVGTFHDGIYRAGFLAKAAVNAFGHINVVTGSTTGTVFTFFHINRNRLRGARRFAELARNASLFTRRVATKRVLAAEARRQRTVFKRIIDRHLGLHKGLADN